MSRQCKISANEVLQKILQDESGSESEFSDCGSEQQYYPPPDADSDSTTSDAEMVVDIDEFSDKSGESENDEVVDVRPNDLVGKSGLVWSSDPPKIHRRQAQDILKEKQGPKRCESVISARSSFSLFITDEIIMIIVRYTNQYARSVYQSWNEIDPEQAKEWKPIDDIECRAFIGLLLLAGVYRSNHESLNELWSVEAGRPVFRATMSMKRFTTILRFCRFDDKNTRLQRKEKDKLAPVSDVWAMFNQTLHDHYKPGAFLTIDEQLVPFRGRCSFRQYMQAKPAKYGLKIWWLCDSTSTFPLHGQVYLGKASDGVREVNQGSRVVKDLMTPWLNTGRNVTTDNFFTSIPLANDLLTNNTTIVGTLRNNKRELPPEMKPSTKRIPQSSIFGFSDNLSLVSYVPKKGKAVNLLSTMHHDKHIPEDGNPAKKPEVVLFYNQTKGEVDNLDKLVSTYTCRRKVLRWPMVIFFNMLDVAAVAALLIWISKFPQWKAGLRSRRRAFLRELGNQLTSQLIERRLDNPRCLQAGVKSGLVSIGYSLTDVRRPEEPRSKRRCIICPRKVDRKVKSVCNTCSRPVCKDHFAKIIICEDCAEK